MANDYYVEPPWIVNALLDVEQIDAGSSVWDPSCGGGNIPKTLAARGIECFGSDIVDRGFGQQFDFFSRGPEPEAEIIISNPPYGVLEHYVEHALKLASDRVMILARLALLEGVSRQHFFKRTPLARVWISSRRVSIPPGGSDIKATGGAIPYAWFIWDHSHGGAPFFGWLPIAEGKPAAKKPAAHMPSGGG